jgi:hypothetical protein
VQQAIRQGDGENGIVCKPAFLRKKGEIKPFDRVVFIGRTDYISGNGAEHVYHLFDIKR